MVRPHLEPTDRLHARAGRLRQLLRGGDGARPGQEKTLTPSRAYVEAAQKVRTWILANAPSQKQLL
jgi:hypothetical protein